MVDMARHPGVVEQESGTERSQLRFNGCALRPVMDGWLIPGVLISSR